MNLPIRKCCQNQPLEKSKYSLTKNIYPTTARPWFVSNGYKVLKKQSVDSYFLRFFFAGFYFIKPLLNLTRLLHTLSFLSHLFSLNRLFSGIIPRMIWLSIGGFVFLGAYDKARTVLLEIFGTSSTSSNMYS